MTREPKLSEPKYDLNLLSTRLERIKNIDSKGNLTFKGFQFEDLLCVLQSSIDFDKSSSIPDFEKMKIFSNAAFSCGEKGEITKSNLLKEIHIEKNKYLNKPCCSYILATTFTIDYTKNIKSVKIDSSTVTFSKSLPHKFNREIDKEKLKNFVSEIHPKFFTSIRVRISARSDSEAAEKALESINFLKGLWNFHLNSKISARINSGKRSPINKIRLGPVHTLHDLNGKIASPFYWYEPQYFHDTSPFKQKINWEKLKEEEKLIRKLIIKSPYGEDLRNSFVRYAQAFDSTDYEFTYLKLWGILEHLTNTVGGKYDNTIRRTIFLYKDRAFQRQILEHLRNYRNLSVHSDKSSEQIETMVFQLKRYVEKLIFFHLNNTGKFNKLSEACDFLDLPTDHSILKNKISLYRKALKFREL